MPAFEDTALMTAILCSAPLHASALPLLRVETLTERFDYVVSRAVTAMPEFVGWIWNRLEKGQKGSLPNGILYLKGGDLAEELALTGKRWHVYDIPRFFGEEFFETKKVVYTPR